MKKLISVFLTACLLLSLSACGSTAANLESEGTVTASESSAADGSTAASNEEEQTAAAEDTSDNPRVLIAYFSRADENYGVGVIEKGNTQIIAEIIAEETGGTLFHIECETAYPAEYDACTEEAEEEKDSNARPALAEDISPDEYDVIYLGYPIWWGDMPMPVYTWLEAHDFAGKTIIPFCTHAGSGLSGTEESISSTCAGATTLDGLAITGETAQNDYDSAEEAVLEWLSKLGTK